jgi:hypothetical protein
VERAHPARRGRLRDRQGGDSPVGGGQGHTDTVGSAADNRKLSLARARAIAAWYHERGLPLPLAYAGFGEDALKVKTPDNTDEAANRRADYIVGVEEPLVARGVRASWYKLQ